MVRTKNWHLMVPGWLVALSWGQALGLLQGAASLVLTLLSIVYVVLQIKGRWPRKPPRA